MRSPAHWIPAFFVLLVAYQAPEGLGARWLQQPMLAAVMMLAFLPTAWIVARTLGLRMGAAYALEWSAGRALWLTAGLALAIIVKGIAVLIGLRMGVYSPGPPTTAVFDIASLSGTLAWLALSTFVPSIAEDILTRGFWARIPEWHWRGLGFVLFSSLLYVFNHVYRLGNGPAEWLMLLCFGLAYATVFWRTGSLWAAVGLHWGWNFAGPALDLAWPTELVNPDGQRWLSAAANLLMLAIVLLFWRRVAPMAGAND